MYCRKQMRRRGAKFAPTAWLGILAAFAIPIHAANALQFFKNFFITGDYVVGGVGLQGQGKADPITAGIVGGTNASYATGTVHVGGVPAGADLVAAFLYWEALESTATASSVGGTFRGYPIGGKEIEPTGAASCVSGGSNQYLRVYRADVLRYLPFLQDPTGKPLSQRFVNDADLVANGFPLTAVALPDGSNGTLVPGATLVVVYRIPTASLKAIVFYDGGYTMGPAAPATLTMLGFYEASKTSPQAKMTPIVGNGSVAYSEHLTVNGGVPPGLSATNPFRAAMGADWDSPTFDVSSLRFRMRHLSLHRCLQRLRILVYPLRQLS